MYDGPLREQDAPDSLVAVRKSDNIAKGGEDDGQCSTEFHCSRASGAVQVTFTAQPPGHGLYGIFRTSHVQVLALERCAL